MLVALTNEFCFQTFSEPLNSLCGLVGGVGQEVAPDHKKPQSGEGADSNETRWQAPGSCLRSTVSRELRCRHAEATSWAASGGEWASARQTTGRRGVPGSSSNTGQGVEW